MKTARSNIRVSDDYFILRLLLSWERFSGIKPADLAAAEGRKKKHNELIGEFCFVFSQQLDESFRNTHTRYEHAIRIKFMEFRWQMDDTRTHGYMVHGEHGLKSEIDEYATICLDSWISNVEAIFLPVPANHSKLPTTCALATAH